MRKERAPYGRPYPKSESALALPNMPEREYQMAHGTKNGKSGGCSRIDRAVQCLRATVTQGAPIGSQETKIGYWVEIYTGGVPILHRQKSILPPLTITKVWFSSYNYKIGHFTSLNFSNRAFYHHAASKPLEGGKMHGLKS